MLKHNNNNCGFHYRDMVTRLHKNSKFHFFSLDNRLATHVVRNVKTIYMLIYNAHIRQSPLNVPRTTTPPIQVSIYRGKKWWACHKRKSWLIYVLHKIAQNCRLEIKDLWHVCHDENLWRPPELIHTIKHNYLNCHLKKWFA